MKTIKDHKSEFSIESGNIPRKLNYAVYWILLQSFWGIVPLNTETDAVVRKCSVKKVFLKTFVKFTGKHLCRSLYYKETPIPVYSFEFCQILKNIFLNFFFFIIIIIFRAVFFLNLSVLFVKALRKKLVEYLSFHKAEDTLMNIIGVLLVFGHWCSIC